MQWILTQVASTGWAVPGVPGDGGTPPWAYSIGLWASYGHPDIAIFGRPLTQLAVIAKTLCRRVADEDFLSPGDEIDDACSSRLAVRDIHPSWRLTTLFYASDQFHGYIRPPMLQVAWADQDANLPWEQRFEPTLADAQPKLWLPVDDHPPGPWTRPAAVGPRLLTRPPPPLPASAWQQGRAEARQAPRSVPVGRTRAPPVETPTVRCSWRRSGTS
jgi:hypothetical protein